jgi:hypothetical protein
MKTMKIKAIALACALLLACFQAGAANSPSIINDITPGTIVADTLVVRPACLAVTAVGTGFFVATLPFALISKSVKQTANTLVVRPARATFTRPLGDLAAVSTD